MRFIKWLKSFTTLESILTILISILIIIALSLLILFLHEDSDIYTPPKSTQTFGVYKDHLKDFPSSEDRPNYIYVPRLLAYLRSTTLNIIPDFILNDYEKQQDKRIKMKPKTSINSIITSRYFAFMVAVINSDDLKKETCSSIIISKSWATTTASCADRIKDVNNYILVRAAFFEDSLNASKSTGLSEVIINHQFKEGVEDFDVALLKSSEDFNLPDDCFARLLSPIAAPMVKVGDAVILVTWDSKIKESDDEVKIDRFTYAIPTFINNQGKLVNWCKRPDEINEKAIGDVCVLNQNPETVGAPVFRGHAVYALVAGNGKLVILANLLDWFEVLMS